jgi:hypothetical protein
VSVFVNKSLNTHTPQKARPIRKNSLKRSLSNFIFILFAGR